MRTATLVAGTIFSIFCLAKNSSLSSGLLQADNLPAGNSSREDARLEQEETGDLIVEYGRQLSRPRYWMTDEDCERTIDEIANRNDPQIDESLIVLANRIIDEDGCRGALSRVGMLVKRVPPRSAEVLSLIGRRKTARSVNYLISLVDSEYPLVRAEISRSLRSFDLLDPENSIQMKQWVSLMWDADPEVALASLSTLKLELPGASELSFEVIRAVIRAQKEISPRVQENADNYFYQEIGSALNTIVKTCTKILRKQEKHAPEGERQAIEKALEILSDPTRTPETGSPHTHLGDDGAKSR